MMNDGDHNTLEDFKIKYNYFIFPFDQDSRRCAYCHGRGDTIDHVVPKSRGGTHSWENCVACCVRCNAKKADRLLEELGWSMTFVPGPPRRGAFGRLWSSEDADPCWEPWLAAAA